MTCVVGLVHEERIWIGGDSGAVAGMNLTVRREPKVFSRGCQGSGELLIGGTSSFRMLNLLRFNLSVPELPTDPRVGSLLGYMVEEFVPACRALFKEHGFAQKTNDAEWGGVFMVGARGELFVIEADFQVGIPALGYAAIGAGAPYALGSLHATAGRLPRSRVSAALEAAAEFCTEVRGPFEIQDRGRGMP